AAPGDVVVVTCGGGAVGRLERHGYRLVVGGRERGGGRGQGCVVGSPPPLCHVADTDAPRVLGDGGHGPGVRREGACLSAPVRGEGLVRLGEAVSVHQHGDRSSHLAGGNRQCAGGSLVVAAGGGGAVRSGIVHRHGNAARGRETDREDRACDAAVAFGHRYVVDGYRRRGRGRGIVD